MLNILVPVDGSENARRALEHVIGLKESGQPIFVRLLNVQSPLQSKVSLNAIASQATLDAYFREMGEEALAASLALLHRAQVPCEHAVEFGPPAKTIADYAQKHGCHRIVMGTRGMGVVSNLVVGSIAYQVVHLTQLPVTLVQ
ncbi:universal stress protein [Chitiniphilus shinanonensis]|uniref:Universal stress protein n=1 Tax=Chitiniphilus shinanonensis TaxID=553088 RepID=A0ABQ6BNX1_9NEIS|nr:universal stress protein [Chitiniphilus shinanonensis]GLS03329.1 universal stress protein [Chitiniphilus shinanonensis]